MATILTKKSDTASAVPLAADLTNAAGGAELAVNATDKRLFSKTSGGTVVELGTNPSTLVLPSGSANGVAYLNGSKVVTSGSALTFDGSNFFGGTNIYASGRFYAQRSSSSLNLPIAGYTDGSAGAVLSGTKGDIVAFGNAGGDGVIFANSNTEQMRLTSTGLGIGTSSPAYKLDVNGNAQVGNATAGTNRYLYINGVANKAGGIIFQESGAAKWYIGNGAASENGNFEIYNALGNNTVITPAGNLGLGVTPSAWTTFKVMQLGNFGAIGGVDSTSMNMFANTFYDGAFKYINTSSASRYRMDDGHSWFTAPSGTAGNAITFTQAMTLDASGNLGVGTTSPTTRLSITDSTGPIVRLVRTSNRFELSADTDFMSLNARDASTYITFKTADTERARINSSGKFLVNTTSTVASGDEIAGFIGTAGISAKATGGSTRFAGSFWNDATTGDNVFLRFYSDGGTERGSITYNRAGGLTVYNTTSDYRAKDIYGPVTGSGALIDSVPVYMGKMKGATQERPMFIAHETPEYAHTGVKDAVDADGNPVYQQMDASALIPVMWAEIQSLRKRLADAGL